MGYCVRCAMLLLRMDIPEFRSLILAIVFFFSSIDRWFNWESRILLVPERVGNWLNRTDGNWTADAEPQTFSFFFIHVNNLFIHYQVYIDIAHRCAERAYVSWRNTQKIIDDFFLFHGTALHFDYFIFTAAFARRSIEILKFISEWNSGWLRLFLRLAYTRSLYG